MEWGCLSWNGNVPGQLRKATKNVPKLLLRAVGGGESLKVTVVQPPARGRA